MTTSHNIIYDIHGRGKGGVEYRSPKWVGQDKGPQKVRLTWAGKGPMYHILRSSIRSTTWSRDPESIIIDCMT